MVAFWDPKTKTNEFVSSSQDKKNCRTDKTAWCLVKPIAAHPYSNKRMQLSNSRALLSASHSLSSYCAQNLLQILYGAECLEQGPYR